MLPRNFRGSRVPRNFGGSRLPRNFRGSRGPRNFRGSRGPRNFRGSRGPRMETRRGNPTDLRCPRPPPGRSVEKFFFPQIFLATAGRQQMSPPGHPGVTSAASLLWPGRSVEKIFFPQISRGGAVGTGDLWDFPLRVSIRGPLLPRKFRGPLLPRKFRGPLLPRKFRGSLLPPKFRGSLLPRKFRGVLLARHRADCKPLRIRGRDEDTDRCRCGGSGGWILLFDKGNTDRDLLQL